MTQIDAYRSIRGQFQQAIALVRKRKLGCGAQHALALRTAQFRLFDFEITRQHGAHLCQRRLQSDHGVGCTTNNLHRVIAGVDFTDPEFVRIRMLFGSYDLRHHNPAELTRHGGYGIHLQPRHGELCCQFIGGQRRIYPLSQPLFRNDHLLPLI